MLISSLVAVALACASSAIPAVDSRPADGGHDVPYTRNLAQLVPGDTNPAPQGRITPFNKFTNTWAGAVYYGHQNGTFRHVSGSMVVPDAIAPPAGGDNTTTYRGSAWVGIDGFSGHCGVILQTGINWAVTSSKLTFHAWYEWYPAPVRHFSGGLTINPGDTLTFTVDATTANSGVATVDNLTTGKSVSQAVSSTASLCSTGAEWIVEDFRISGKTVPFANFGAVTFTNATAVVNGESTIGPVYATLLDIMQNGTVHTHASSTDSTVTINYIG